MTNYYLGIDPSLTGTGVVLIDNLGKIINQELILTKSTSEIEDRIFLITSKILDLLKKYKNSIKKIYIEGLAFGAKGSAMFQLAGLHFHLRIQIRELIKNSNIILEIIPPTTIKKFITGKGNVKKQLMLLEIYKKFGIEFSDDNIADAYSLARFALENDK